MIPSNIRPNPPPSTYRQLVALYQTQYNASVAAGEYVPYVYPYRSFGIYLVVLYFLLPPSRSTLVYYAKYPVFAICVYTCIAAMRECRSASVTGGYGIGLANAFAILYFAALMVFNDARRDFKRIEMLPEEREKRVGKTPNRQSETASNVNMDKDGLRARISKDRTLADLPDISSSPTSKARATTSTPPLALGYTWQGLPSTLSTRLSWTIDLFTSSRGPGWTYRIPTIPVPPPCLPSPTPPATAHSPTGNFRYPTTTSLLLSKLLTVGWSYLALDLLKVIMMHDHYFWGYISSPPPSYFLNLPFSSPGLTRAYRLLLCIAGAYSALQGLSALLPIVLIPCRFLGPCRTAPWQYPDMYGTFDNIFEKGIRGGWGGWWHQGFRFPFEAPTTWAVGILGWEKKSIKAKLLGLAIAFTCSAWLHVCASYTSWGQTYPLSGSGLFFVLQGVGILGEMAIEQGVTKTLSQRYRNKIPRWMKRWTRFLAVNIWLYYTGPLVCDDFSRCGIWLMEPVPISLIRGLGFGLEGEGWWCWGGAWISWWSGERWWQSGLAL